MAIRPSMLWISAAALALSGCYANSSTDEEQALDDELGEGTTTSDDGGAPTSDAAVSDAASDPACTGDDLLAQLACQLGGQGSDAGAGQQSIEDLLGGFADLLGGGDAGAAGQIDFQGILEGLRGGADGAGGMARSEGGLGGTRRDAGAAPGSSRGGEGWRSFGRARDAGTGVDASVPGGEDDGETLEPPATEPVGEDAGSVAGEVIPVTSVDSGL